MTIPVRCSYIRRKDMDSVLTCMVEDSVDVGGYLGRFLRTAKEQLGFEQGAAFRSPYSALGCALDCFALPEGTVVALSALAPSYYADVLKEKRFIPLWLDVSAETACIDADALKKARESARMLLLHEGAGIFPDPAEYLDFGIPIIEDVSQSVGAFIGEAKAGSLGSLTLLAMEQGGLVTAGGGALLYAHGKREGQVLKNALEAVPGELVMTDFNAALGLSQIKNMEKEFEKRRELARLFNESLSRSKHAALRLPGEGESAYFGLPVVLPAGVKDVRAYARKKEVETTLAFEESCVSRGVVPEGECPRAASLAMRCLVFPLHSRIGKTAAQKVSKVLATLP